MTPLCLGLPGESPTDISDGSEERSACAPKFFGVVTYVIKSCIFNLFQKNWPSIAHSFLTVNLSPFIEKDT